MVNAGEIAMRSRVLLLAFVVAVSCFGVACTDSSSTRADPASLIGTFRSFQSIESARDALVPAMRNWVIIENERRPPDYWAYIVLARDYEHLHQSGDLLLSFVGGRLMETRFYPLDRRAYVVALRQTGLGVALDKPVMAGMHVRVSMGRDERADYVAWLDLRLEEQAWRAIKRHS